MPTVIDSLVVELGLDPKNFTKGQQAAIDAAKKAQQELEGRLGRFEDSASSAGHTFNNLRNQALGALAVFTGGRGVVEFGKQIAQTDAAVSRTARSFGLSIEGLAQWRGAAAAAGGSADGITSTITGLVGAVQQFSMTGESSVVPYFRAMGIQLVDAKGKMRDFRDLLMDFTRYAKGRDAAEASAMLSAAGVDTGTISMILQGEAAVQKLIATQKELGSVNKQSAASSEGLVKSWNEMSTAAESLGRIILTWAAPALISAMNRWRNVFGELSKGKIVSEDSVLGRLLSDKDYEGRFSVADWYKKNFGNSYADAKEKIDKGIIPGTPTEESGAVARKADGKYADPAAAEKFIRRELAARNIDPEVGVRVAKAEGFNGFVSSVPGEKSYGAFQLNISKDPSKPSLGDRFVKDTGLDPSDPKNEAATIKYALDEVARTRSWAQWYGARNNNIANRQGLENARLPVEVAKTIEPAKPIVQVVVPPAKPVEAPSVVAKAPLPSTASPPVAPTSPAPRSGDSLARDWWAWEGAAKKPEAAPASPAVASAKPSVPAIAPQWPALPPPNVFVPQQSSSSSTTTSTTTIDTIHVNAPQATDAQGIATALKPAMQQQSLATQANTGLN